MHFPYKFFNKISHGTKYAKHDLLTCKVELRRLIMKTPPSLRSKEPVLIRTPPHKQRAVMPAAVAHTQVHREIRVRNTGTEGRYHRARRWAQRFACTSLCRAPAPPLFLPTLGVFLFAPPRFRPHSPRCVLWVAIYMRDMSRMSDVWHGLVTISNSRR